MPSAHDDTFFALTPERVLEAVEVGGRRATGWAMALNSLENRVYEVELEDGERLVAKFYRPERWSRESILEEHAFLAELAAEELPVVPPIDLDAGRGAPRTLGVVARGGLPDGKIESSGILYAVFPKVRGRSPEEMDEGQLAQIGRLLARLHVVGSRREAPARGRLTPATYGAASLRFLADHEVVPHALQRAWSEVSARVLDGCERAFAALDDVSYIRVHGDCHLGNLLWGRLDGLTGPFFLDFDDFLAAPPVQDLWLVSPGIDEEALAAREAILAGYETMRDFDRRTLRLVEPLRALRILRYSAWIAQRWQDPAFQRAFPDFDEPAYWYKEIQALSEQQRRLEHGEPLRA